MKNYGIKEWFVCIAGWAVLGIQIYWYATNTYEVSNLNIGALFIAVIFMFAPKRLVDMVLRITDAVVTKYFNLTHKTPEKKDPET